MTVVARPVQGAVTERLGGSADNPSRGGKSVVTLDLKQPAGTAEAMAIVAKADALIEGNRPGVMERLGLGPAHCAAHPRMRPDDRLEQQGPLSQAAGHDLNYVALTGLLSLSARPGQQPIVPPTVVGDASGALGLAFGIACALVRGRAPAATGASS